MKDGRGIAPLSVDIGARERLLLRAALGAVGVAIIVAIAYAVLGFGITGKHAVVKDAASSVVCVLSAGIVIMRAARVKQDRGPWIVLAVGLSLYAAGNVLWSAWLQHAAAVPIPSICDALWLSLYPASYVGLLWLARGHGRGARAGVWLDGIVAGLGIAAIGAAVVFQRVLDGATGSTPAVITNLAYPVADMILASLVMGVFALRGWRLDRVWAMIGGGFLLLSVADVIYLLEVAAGSPQSNAVANCFYLPAVGLLALAAWQPAGRLDRRLSQGWSLLLIPSMFVCAAIGVLLYGQYSGIHDLAAILAAVTVLVALVRTAFTFHDARAIGEMRRQALTDDLTSLPNRRLFVRRAFEAIAGARPANACVALLLIDLDHFKELNDTLGHAAGDHLLAEIGPRLREQLRPADTLARLGGDEFGLILEDADEAYALHVAHGLREALRTPFAIDGIQLRVAASIGIALFPEHADEADKLLQQADIAMYEAKAEHTGAQVYARERDTNSRANLALVGELPHAIESGEIVLHFQPKADARTHAIVGVEALARWNHPQHGLLPPAAFVPLADHAGLGRDLTRCVVDSALAQCRTWKDGGHDLPVSVNTTVADLIDAGLPAEVSGALLRHGLEAGSLVIEVTETSILHDPRRIGDVLGRLDALGVCVSLDDFGTGYSSLAHLKSMPVREIKIDRSFVARMTSDPTDTAIVRSTIDLARSLGIRVVAEGVEDKETWEMLERFGCQLVQGYVISRPVTADALSALLAEPRYSVPNTRSPASPRPGRM
jgi:diguanylate cyclase (GGDEF)-like protein